MLFNIDHATFRIFAACGRVPGAGGVAAPLLAALWPVLSGAQNVRARSDCLVRAGRSLRQQAALTSGSIAFRSDSCLQPTRFRLSNMFRRKGRLALTQGVLILAGTMFLMVLTLANSMNVTLENELDRAGPTIFASSSLNHSAPTGRRRWRSRCRASSRRSRGTR